MKYAYLALTMIILFSGCWLSKNKKRKEAVKVPVEEAVDALSEKAEFNLLAKGFTKAIKNNDLAGIQNFYPTLELAKYLIKDQEVKKTDDEVQLMLNTLKSRFESNIQIIQDEMVTAKVNLSIFNYVDYTYEDDATMPAVMSLNYDNDGKPVSIAVTVMRFNDKLYVFEILNTRSLFD